MNRLRAVRFLIPGALFVGTLWSYSEPIKKALFSTYDLRWNASKMENSNERSETVAVHNSGTATSPTILLDITLLLATRKSVVDFDFAPVITGPRTSFLEMVSHSDFSGLGLPYTEIIRPIIEHAGSSLYGLDQSLDEIRANKLRASGASGRDAETFLSTATAHETWLRKCKGDQNKGPMCRLEKALEEWEQWSGRLKREGVKKWQESTGIEVKLPGSRLSPGNKVYFAFALKGDESCFLTLRYGLDPIKPVAEISSAAKQIIYVDDEKYLEAAAWKVFAVQHPYQAGMFVVMVVGFLWFAWPALRPLKTRPTYQIFNMGLKTDDEEFWEVAYQRVRYFLLEEFRRLSEEFDRVDLMLSSEELFGFVKDCLRREAAVQRHGV